MCEQLDAACKAIVDSHLAQTVDMASIPNRRDGSRERERENASARENEAIQ